VVRANAALVLGSAGNDSAGVRLALNKALKDANERVRRNAADALRELERGTARPKVPTR
jgi:HEAT repeat protein